MSTQTLTNILLAFAIVSSGITATADEPDDELPGFERREIATYRFEIALKISSISEPVSSIVATTPVPTNWPEQSVELLHEVRSPGVQTDEKDLNGMGAMLAFQARGIPAKGEASVIRIYEVTRYATRFTVDPAGLSIPEKLPREMRVYLEPAPGIEIRNGRVEKLHKELHQPEQSAWQNVLSYYDWIRNNVRYRQDRYRGAAFAIEKRYGDCEDLTALFVSLCRATKIPARTVWVEDHAYGEFYLVDNGGQGYWIPVEMTGPRWFGETRQTAPILQKGDEFYDSIRKQKMHYIPQSARSGRGQIRYSATRRILDNNDTRTTDK